MPTFPICWLDPVADEWRLDRLDIDADLPDLAASENGDELQSVDRAKPDDSFWSAPIELRELIARQGLKPARRIEDLRADFWPDDESVDEFIAMIRRWRSEGG